MLEVSQAELDLLIQNGFSATWDGGGDSGCIEITEGTGDPKLDSIIEEYCYDELGYGSWAGEWSSSGSIEFIPEENIISLSGHELYYEDVDVLAKTTFTIPFEEGNKYIHGISSSYDSRWEDSMTIEDIVDPIPFFDHSNGITVVGVDSSTLIRNYYLNELSDEASKHLRSFIETNDGIEDCYLDIDIDKFVDDTFVTLTAKAYTYGESDIDHIIDVVVKSDDESSHEDEDFYS